MKNSFRLLTILFISIVIIENTFSQKLPDEKYKQVKKHSIYSEVLNEERRVFIYLPDNYSKEKAYPVLYMLDGDRSSYFDLAFTACSDEAIGEHIIIGIDTKENRRRDMIPVEVAERPGSGGAENFLLFLKKELKPFVEEQYPSQGIDILYGGSNAGLFVVYALLHSPEIMDSYIASSPMIGWGPGFMNEKLNTAESGLLKNKILYVYFGMKDRYKQVTEYLPAYCKALKLKHGQELIFNFKSMANEGHVPPESLKEGLKFIHSHK